MVAQPNVVIYDTFYRCSIETLQRFTGLRCSRLDAPAVGCKLAAASFLCCRKELKRSAPAIDREHTKAFSHIAFISRVETSANAATDMTTAFYKCLRTWNSSLPSSAFSKEGWHTTLLREAARPPPPLDASSSKHKLCNLVALVAPCVIPIDMPAFSQRCPDDLHQAMRVWLNERPWLNQTELVNGALSAMIGYPDYRVNTAPPTLADYQRIGAMDEVAHQSLSKAIRNGQLIAVMGPRQSGRSSLLSALIAEYQSIGSTPRRAMVVSTIPGELTKNTTPLYSVTLSEESMQNRPLIIPDTVESVFVDDLSETAMEGAVQTWKRHGGAFTLRGNDVISIPTAINDQVAVMLSMRDGKVAMLVDRLPLENTPEKIEQRSQMRELRAADVLFDKITTWYETRQRLIRRGPNSGRSQDSITRRSSIRTLTGSIGTLEIMTVMPSAGAFERRITWTSNTTSTKPAASVLFDITSFEDAKRHIG